MNSFKLRITSPDGDQYSGDVVMLSLRGTEGDLAIMAGHIPFVTAVKPCKLKVETEEDEFFAEIDGGLLSVTNDETVLLSSDYKAI